MTFLYYWNIKILFIFMPFPISIHFHDINILYIFMTLKAWKTRKHKCVFMSWIMWRTPNLSAQKHNYTVTWKCKQDLLKHSSTMHYTHGANLLMLLSLSMEKVSLYKDIVCCCKWRQCLSSTGRNGLQWYPETKPKWSALTISPPPSSQPCLLLFNFSSPLNSWSCGFSDASVLLSHCRTTHFLYESPVYP